jgi:N-acetylglucosamine-6-sulfatase
VRRVCTTLPFLLLAGCLALAGCLPPGEETPKEDNKEPKPPNVVLILTDDLAFGDVNPATLKHMPNLGALMAEGTTFDNAFATNSLCCPSRATILRGQYTHNHQILHNQPPLGGAERFRLSGGDGSTMASWVEEQGYSTAFFGKYLNGYSGHYVPPGWEEWHAVSGNFLSDDLNENGHIVSYDADDGYHLDDVLSEKASDYAERAARPEPPFFTADRPFLMWIGTKAPHQPASPASRDENAYPNVSLPRPPSFDEGDVSDKPAWIRDNPPLSSEQKVYMEKLHRKRLQSMLAVDDMIGDLVGALRKGGKLEDTYIVFTSDNGFHLGNHRLGAGKWTAYEEDIRVPLVVRGPGVPEGKTLQHVVLTNDLAPTFAELAGAEIPSFVDGRSFKPLLTDDPPPLRDWRQRFVIEAVAERGGVPRPPLVNESEVTPLLTGDPLPNDWRKSSAAAAQSSEEWGRPWMKALRTNNYLYVEYKTGEHELYDLRKDPYELDNEYSSATPELKRRLEAQLDALRQCSAEECRMAEDG